MHDLPFHDVVIAGAGPVGLMLACELRLAGASVVILEQAAASRSPSQRTPFGLRGLSSPSIDALRLRGLLDAVTPPTDAAAPARRHGSHFAGLPFHADHAGAWPHRLAGPAHHSLAIDLGRLEFVLAARAADLGVAIRRGVAVDGLTVSDDYVAVHAGGVTVHGRWLVGCDGGRSTVRKAAGFQVDGTAPEFTGYSAEVRLADPDALAPGRHHTPGGFYMLQPPGTLAMVDYDGGAFHRTRRITRAHVQSVLRRVSGADVALAGLTLATTWTDRAFQASTYRRGRVLLAGDAAHIHAPLGGQGLNLGLGDAMNLGWKLAATVRGDAPDGLLDSYTTERHPAGAQVLDWSRAQVALMRPEPGARALAAIVRDLIALPDGATYCAERVFGLSLRYDLGCAHPLAGRSAPDFALDDGTTLGERLRAGIGLLLDFAPGAPLHLQAGRWGARVAYVACGARETLGSTAMLVRPDGIVAWATDGAPDPHEVARAGARWFGGPGH
jgi:2-polyprenyl-6-methoxyphenol hydroxylase-like FAD-dependent oxidoreductase